MDREAFEQLVSAWLDQPERPELRARIDAALAETPELGGVLAAWLRLDELVHSATPPVAGLDWSQVRRRIAAGVDEAVADDELDRRLRTLTGVETFVDWPRLRERISTAAHAAGGRRRRVRFPLRRVAAGLGIAAAAAALAFMLTLPTGTGVVPGGWARVHVSAPGGLLTEVHPGAACARVAVTRLADEGAPGATPPERASGGSEPQLVEVFLMIEPARVPRAPGVVFNAAGFH